MKKKARHAGTRREDDAGHHLTALYGETRTPLMAWYEYAEARRRGTKIPDWVLTYFDGVAGRLNALTYFSAELPTPTDEAIVQTLGFKRAGRGRGGNVYERHRQHLIEIALVACVAAYLSDGQAKTNAVYLTMQRFHVDESTVKRAWRIRRALFAGQEVGDILP